MNDGKKIEKIVRLIQETLKDIPKTRIYSNHRIPNTSGRKREIDVLIISEVNTMTIKIAIECKNLKIPVPVEKIEAFNSKCLRINGISKKVFVSASGYQADSIEAAKCFEIELYTIDEISKEKIVSWFPISQLKMQIKIKLPLKIQFSGDSNDIKKLPQDYNLLVHYKNKKDISIHILGYVWNHLVIEKQQEIRSFLILNFLKRKDTERIDQHYSLPFSLTINGVHTIGNDNSKIVINKIDSELEVWFEESPSNIIGAQSYKNEKEITKANTVTIDIGKNQRSDIVFADEKLGIFHTDSKGNLYELKTLAKYDPKTDKLEILKKTKNEG